MVVFIIHLVRTTVLESERHAIVLIDPYRKPATLEGMEPHPRHVHLSRMRRSIERGQDQLQTLRMLRLYLAGVPCPEQRRKRPVYTRPRGQRCDARGQGAEARSEVRRVGKERR